jgi:hypothetical protein
MKQGGIMGASDYPYEAEKKKCRFDLSKSQANVTNCHKFQYKTEDELKEALYQNGPIGIGKWTHQFSRYAKIIHIDRIMLHTHNSRITRMLVDFKFLQTGVSSADLHGYNKGVLQKCRAGEVDHALLLVGYGEGIICIFYFFL